LQQCGQQKVQGMAWGPCVWCGVFGLRTLVVQDGIEGEADGVQVPGHGFTRGFR
jgi:hypothetical protein